MKTTIRSFLLTLCMAVIAGSAVAEQTTFIWPSSGGSIVKRWYEEPTFADEVDLTFGTRRLVPTPADQHTQNSYRGYIWFDLSAVPAGAAISYASLPLVLTDDGLNAPCTRALGFLDHVSLAEWNSLDDFQRYTYLGDYPFEWEQEYPSAAYEANYPHIYVAPRFLWRRDDLGVFLRTTSDEASLRPLAPGSLFSFSDGSDFVESPSDQLTVEYALAPALVAPADGAALDELEPVILEWTQVLDADSTLRYRLQYSSRSDFAADVTDGVLNRDTTQFDIGYVAAGTRIYWRLRVEEAAASGTTNFSAWSTARSFITEGRYGSLRVNISPASVAQAVIESERGQWQVDERAGWNDSGTTATALGTAMQHTVVFKTIPGWTAPPNQTVSVNSDTTTILSGTYTLTPGTGGVKIDIQPDSLATALDPLNRAQWRVDGGPWQDDSVPAAALGPGLHTVSFKPVNGWTTPPAQVVNVLSGTVIDVTGTYALNGSLTVTIDPPIVRDALFSAAWKIDNGLWWSSGAVLPVPLAPGLHTISFKGLSGWNAPAVQEFFVEPGMAVQITGTYTLAPLLTGSLTVNLSPAEVNTDATNRARWSVDGVNWWFSGETKIIPAGEWTLEFSELAGWKNPVDVPVTIVPGGAATINRTYGAVTPKTISGYVLEAGAGLANAKVIFSNGAGQATTDATGFYTIDVPSQWSGTATPTAPDGTGLGYFDPQARTYSGVAANLVEQSFTWLPKAPGDLRGNYAGLVFAENGAVGGGSTGSIRIAVKPTGAFSGVLRYDTLRIPLRGRFDDAGTVTLTRTLRDGDFQINLQLFADSETDRIGGRVWLGSSLPSGIRALEIVYRARSNPAPQAGRYTASIQPPSNNTASLPKGFGFGAIRIAASGQARFVGRLADNRVISFSSPICGIDQWPVFLRFGGGYQMLAGWCRVSASTLPHPVTLPDMAGVLDWIGTGDGYAMALRTSLAGFRYTQPGAGERIIDCPDIDGNAQAMTRASVSDTASEFRKTFTLTSRNRVSFAGDSESRFTILPRTGLFSGRMMDAGGIARPAYGAFLRSQKRAFGFVVTDDNTRPLTLAPTP